MAVPKQITLRGPSPALTRRLRALAEASGESLNSTILQLLELAVGYEARRERLIAEAEWSDEDARDFDETLGSQRVIDAELWK